MDEADGVSGTDGGVFPGSMDRLPRGMTGVGLDQLAQWLTRTSLLSPCPPPSDPRGHLGGVPVGDFSQGSPPWAISVWRSSSWETTRG